VCYNTPELFLVTEYMQRGDLFHILHNDDIVIEYEHVRKMSIDTCCGMTYLHNRKIIHRDLKTFNLLVDFDWNIKVCDFGLSRVLEGSQADHLTFCGTTAWAAPEVLREHSYCLKADIYSFGICLWEMCTRDEPYKELTAPQVVIAVAVNGLRPPIDRPIFHEFVRVMTECWSESPEDRPEFKDLLKTLASLRCPKKRSRKPYSKTGSTSSAENILIATNRSSKTTSEDYIIPPVIQSSKYSHSNSKNSKTSEDYLTPRSPDHSTTSESFPSVDLSSSQRTVQYVEDSESTPFIPPQPWNISPL